MWWSVVQSQQLSRAMMTLYQHLRHPQSSAWAGKAQRVKAGKTCPKSRVPSRRRLRRLFRRTLDEGAAIIVVDLGALRCQPLGGNPAAGESDFFGRGDELPLPLL